jgi:calcineurin-like phosphoesterase family protein
MKWFTADCHFGHEKLAKSRGFTGSEEHDAHLLDILNMLVKRNDELLILGDFAFGNPQKYRLRIACRHVKLIIGNHDKPLASTKTFGDVRQIYTTKVCGQHSVLCHYPMAFWPASHHGSFHLYGHTHAMRECTLDKAFPGRRSIDVGVDNAKRLFDCYTPFNEQWIYNTLIERESHDLVTYYDAQRAM